MTRTGWAVVTLMLCLAVSEARAQTPPFEGMLELPLVVRSGGWARYLGTSSEGPTRFVIKVGAPGRHGARSGRWFHLLLEVPSVGHIAFDFLVEGERFGAQGVILLRVTVPGQPPREHPSPFARTASAPRQPRFLQKSTETIAGKVVEIMEYSFSGGLTAEWSSSVPGLGLVRMGGENPFHLVDFGVGGDPWKERTTPALFPAPPPRK